MERCGEWVTGCFAATNCLGKGGSRPCRNVWCGPCYREAASNTFPRLDRNAYGNGSDLELDMPETYDHYHSRRNGDHLMGVPLSVTSARSKTLQAGIRCWETTAIISL